MGGEYKRLTGFADIHGEQAAAFAEMELSARTVFSHYGYEELRTPIVEATNLFQRSIGTETDVVKKEMFTFADRNGKSITLRPEATAGVLRACAEENLLRQGGMAKYFTIGPMFRYERPQKGRLRQFHQINCECLGVESPVADAEIICMLLDFLGRLGIGKLLLKINSLGCGECRPAYLEKLRAWLDQCGKEKLCEDCRERLVSNPLRVLDCKKEACQAVLKDAPLLLDYNCPACKSHFETTLKLLEANGVRCEIDHHLVRGLDYYQRVAFEVASFEIGSQTAVAGGGRYDGLLGRLGGPDAPGIGFACGMERVALLMQKSERQGLDFYLLVLDESLRETGFRIAQNLRKENFAGEMNYGSASFKSLMRQASKSGAPWCLLLGTDEAQSGSISVKDLRTGEQVAVAQSALPEILRK